MKWRLFSLLLLFVCMTANASQGREGGNGGGGVVRNGTYMTFYSAGLYVEPISPAEAPVRIPAIQKLTRYFTSMKFLRLRSKNPFLMAIQPTTDRQYMIAAPELLTPTIKARLLAEFQRVTKVDPSELELFAITDTSQKITYILPGFEKLSLNDQMSILFHEAYWILHPNATYNEVVKVEMAFEATLNEPNNAAAAFDFVGYLGNSTETLAARMKWELDSGNLKGFVNDQGQFTLAQLFGDDYLGCIRSLDGRQSDKEIYPYDQSRNSKTRQDSLLKSSDLCAPYFRAHLNDLILQYPRSMVFKDIAKNFDGSKPLLLIPYEANFSKMTESFFGKRDILRGCFVEGEKTRKIADIIEWPDLRYDWDVERLASCVVTLGGDDLNTQCSSYSLTVAQRFEKPPAGATQYSCYGCSRQNDWIDAKFNIVEMVVEYKKVFQCVGKSLGIHIDL